ncbi:uncharacterized protein A4U43_C01F24600 [Asparagus officinalis]|uniref:Uncharacterized protein n=1 Tax=Asparagus officinalis TaxID=4686 RepID=A0A5P1FW19_ASPOF|nr:uncharacterized protein A4U43_C01F24600 [Asparagus officinalis]
MAPHHAISRGRGFVRGSPWSKAEDVPVQQEMDMVSYSTTPVYHHNHYGHDGTHDPKMAYAFDGNVPLFLDGSS